jgi:hypothetical protein
MSSVPVDDHIFRLRFFRSKRSKVLKLRARWRKNRESAHFEMPDLDDPHDGPAGSREQEENRGARIFRALFPRRIKKLLDRALAVHQEGLEIRLEIPAKLERRSDLEKKPWEAAFNPKAGDFLGLSRSPVLIRAIGKRVGLKPLPGAPHVQVLVVGANPKTGYTQFDMEGEIAAIRYAWQGRGVVWVRANASFEQFRRAVRDMAEGDGLHILHFLGHAGLDSETPHSVLVFERDGEEQRVQASDVATFLQGYVGLRLVILSACSTAKPSEKWHHDPSRSIAYALLRSGIPAVIGTRNDLTNKGSRPFLAVLHQMLADGKPIGRAAAEARREVALATLDDGAKDGFRQWTTPILYLRTAGSDLFQFEDRDGIAELRLAVVSYEHPYNRPRELTLDLHERFFSKDDRRPRPGIDWNADILPALHDFLKVNVSDARPLRLRFDAHLSLCFAAGFCIGMRSIEITVLQSQRGRGGFEAWRFEGWPRSSHPHGWAFETTGESESDLAVVVSVTHDIVKDVSETWQALHPERSCLFLEATLPSNDVRGAKHALALAEALVKKIRTVQGAHRLHLFLSCPAAFAFCLGQNSVMLGEIQLYDHLPGKTPRYQIAMKVDTGDGNGRADSDTGSETGAPPAVTTSGAS